MSFRKIFLLAVVVLGLAAFFFFDLGRFLSLDYLKQSQARFEALYAAEPLTVSLAYFALYVVATALSFPGAAIITLAGGAIFGLWWGTLLVSFASSLGATLAFLVSRFVLRDSIEAKFGNRLAEINRGIEKDGAFYLFTLRLIPVVPFFVINLVMGLTKMKALTFYAVSQVGMLAGTLVYVNAGTQLAQIESLQGILSPALLGSFVVGAAFAQAPLQPLLQCWTVLLAVAACAAAAAYCPPGFLSMPGPLNLVWQPCLRIVADLDGPALKSLVTEQQFAQGAAAQLIHVQAIALQCAARRDAAGKHPGFAMPAQVHLAHPAFAVLGQIECQAFIGA